ncbi:hypothetical protein [Desulfococcus sp.]|uniref:DUF7450 family protein n=1 Tax=Desulfococcus sp. TaxID=2025834 RepID=UPI0035941D70
MLLPVEKFRDHSGFPESLDHFKCYVVQGPKGFKLKPPITLSDQFDKQRGRIETITELSPAFFCVPVDKNDTKRKNPDEHLALYDITPHDVLTPPIPATVRGQFGTVPLIATESILLAVPTEKKRWKEVSGPGD